MSRICPVLNKRPQMGNKISRRGISKKAGGIGLKTTGIKKRRFLPNLQKVRVIVDGQVMKVRVSTKAIKAGLIEKAPKRIYV